MTAVEKVLRATEEGRRVGLVVVFGAGKSCWTIAVTCRFSFVTIMHGFGAERMSRDHESVRDRCTIQILFPRRVSTLFEELL